MGSTLILLVYQFFLRPSIKSKDTNIVQTGDIARLQKDIINLRDNHIHALQGDVDELKIGQACIKIILEERLPKK